MLISIRNKIASPLPPSGYTLHPPADYTWPQINTDVLVPLLSLDTHELHFHMHY